MLLNRVETTGEGIASQNLEGPGKSLLKGVETTGKGVVETTGEGIASEGLGGTCKSLLRGVETIGEGVVSWIDRRSGTIWDGLSCPS